jgi:hypothetical protein
LPKTARWRAQSRLDTHSSSCPKLRARGKARLFRIGEIFPCHSGGRSRSLV